MENCLVSIIIPVYNVKQYLNRCIDSVINQVYRNIEIILIDDGSTDGSDLICDEYEKKDIRIKVVHEKNGGLSCARNKGIRKSTGKYICFVDSDDFIHKEYISLMHELAMKSAAEIIICGYQKGKRNKFKHRELNGLYNTYTSAEMLKNWHSSHGPIETVVWNKMYLRELLCSKNFKYPEGLYYEDVYTTHLIVARANKIAVTKNELYYYYQHKNSITSHLKLERNIRDNLVAQNERIRFFEENGYIEAVKRLKIGREKYYMLMYCLTKSKSLKKELKSLYKESYPEVCFYNETKGYDKMLFKLFELVFVH